MAKQTEDRDWQTVRTWVFDLDNTLYAPSAGLLDQVDRLMTDFIAQRLGVSLAKANDLRAVYWRQHGATMTGLVNDHGVDPDEFLAASHRLDLSTLVPDPSLRQAIGHLPGRKVIHTNGPASHAERVLMALDLHDRFDSVIALEDTGYIPKPAALAHKAAAERGGYAASGSVMIEDTAPNLHHPAQMGMTTVWLDHHRTTPPPDHVHHAISDLTGFLRSVADDLG